MTFKDDELNSEAPGTPADAAAYLATLMGGKVDASLPETVPVVPAEKTDPDDGKATPIEPVLDSSNAVVASKDGKYVIEYEKLVEAREGRKTAQARVIELEAQLQSASERAGANVQPTQADTNAAIANQAIKSGIDPELFGDFSEGAIAAGVNKLVDARVTAALEDVNAKVDAVLSPIKQQQATDASQTHMGAIYKAHADADSIVDSKEFNDWVESQPTFARNAYKAVLDTKTGGTAQEVIELFDSFKAATGRTEAGAQQDAKAAARAALAKAAIAQVPNSLSDIPGGRSGATDKFEALDAMAPAEQTTALMRMSQADRDGYMNR